MATCAVPHCGQTALRYQVFHGALCHFCIEHYTMAVRVHRELPMAIQEMHAWALFGDDGKTGPAYRAITLVNKLRDMEWRLEGI